jgi:hypothetical protein
VGFLVDTVAPEQVPVEAVRFSRADYHFRNTPHLFVCHPGDEQ